MNHLPPQVDQTEPFTLPWWAAKTGVIAELQAQACLSQREFTDALDEMLAQTASAGEPENAEDGFDPDGKAAAIYKANLPQLSSRRDTQLYIAAVAQGVQHGLVTGAEAKLFLYTAQLALAAFSGPELGPLAPPLSTRGVKP